MKASERDTAILNGCFIEVYDDGVVFTSKEGGLTVSYCNFIFRPGEEMPKLRDGQMGLLVPPRTGYA